MDIDSLDIKTIQPGNATSSDKSSAGSTSILDSLRLNTLNNTLAEFEAIKNLTSENKSIMGDDRYLNDMFRNAISSMGDKAGKTSGTEELFQKIETFKKTTKMMDPEKVSDNDSISEHTHDPKTGKVYHDFGKCSVCGKPLDAPSSSGFCSLKCQIEYRLKIISGLILPINTVLALIKAKSDNIVGKLKAAVTITNTLVSAMKDLASDLTNIPNMNLDADTYMIYFKAQLTAVIIRIKKEVNNILIWKNNLIIAELEKKEKNIDALSVAPLQSLFSSINAVAAAADDLNTSFNTAYAAAQKVINIGLPMMKLEAESMNLGMTPKSMTVLPGKIVNKVPNENLYNSGFTNVITNFGTGMTMIETTVENMFPPIQEYEYLMDPKAFNVRKLLSPMNYSAIQKFVDPLMMLMSVGTQALPKYEKLTPINIWWVLFLLSDFGPYCQKHYALPGFVDIPKVK